MYIKWTSSLTTIPKMSRKMSLFFKTFNMYGVPTKILNFYSNLGNSKDNIFYILLIYISNGRVCLLQFPKRTEE